ncbi:YiaA/YiaB family inner membrane protein, partial [Ralstonia pseudosolanacearum]
RPNGLHQRAGHKRAAFTCRPTCQTACNPGGVHISDSYYGLCWLSALLAVGLLCVGLYNATLAQSEKGFFGMAYALALFGAIAVQKNTRDITATKPVTLEARLAQLREEAPKAPALNPAAASETPVRRG